MLQATWQKFDLIFKNPAKTSRSIMTRKSTYFVRILDELTGRSGIGEAALFQGLSAENTPKFEILLDTVCKEINRVDLKDIPSSAIRFGIETAMADLSNGGIMQPFYEPNKPWRHKINGLVWMADKSTMRTQAEDKLERGFQCVKLKIGGINFEEELEILAGLRKAFDSNILEIRLDANGAFSKQDALLKLDRLSKFDIHSLEQPIKPGQHRLMGEICRNSPIPIALDEELIGLNSVEEKQRMISEIKPAYIIIKPSLCGGFNEADSWIEVASQNGIGWWATSALESDIGLNAIARWLAEKKNVTKAQGLGTGQLYINNFPSPLCLDGQWLLPNYEKQWDLSRLTI